MPSSPLRQGNALDTTTYVVWICPDCGEQITTEPVADPFTGEYFRGHYHDPPEPPEDAGDDYDAGPDPWVDAVEIKTVSVDNLNDRVRAAYDAGKEDAQ